MGFLKRYKTKTKTKNEGTIINTQTTTIVNNQGEKVHDPFAAHETAHRVIGVLNLRVLEAKLSTESHQVLITGQSMDAIAPFVVVSLCDQRYETRVVEKEHPVWNQQYNILIHNDTLDEKLTVDLMNMSTFIRYQKLGSFSVRLRDLIRSHDVEDERFHINTEITKHSKFGHKKISVPVAEIHLKYQLRAMDEVTNKFWVNFAKQFDFDKNGEIDPFELACMLQALGSTLDDSEIEDLMRGKGDVPIQNFPDVMAQARKNHLVRITHCPVCQDRIIPSRSYSRVDTKDEAVPRIGSRLWEGAVCTDDAEVIAHIGPCIESYAEEDMLNRNFIVDMVGISWWKEGMPEWKNFTQHIRDSGNFVVFNRETRTYVEEKIPVFSKMAMRAAYSVLPRKPEIAKDFLHKMTTIVGVKYNESRSRKYIAEFIRFYNIQVDDLLDPISSFQNFNEFFRRKMKPHSRPIADVRNQHIAVVPADCRIVAYETVAETSTLWVKGHEFSIASLVMDPDLTKRFTNGSVAVCRLGPMDTHMVYFPLGCKVGRTFYMDGEYLVDNPIAVREDVDVFTTNKRVLTVLEDTEFGLVGMVLVGSTMIGSIEITSKQGHMVKKGDEHGYFQFGGSTVILLFEPNRVVFAEDLLTNSTIPIETYCKMGSPLGVLRK